MLSMKQITLTWLSLSGRQMSSHSLQIDKGSFLDGHNLTHGFAERNWLHLRVPHMSQHAFCKFPATTPFFFWTFILFWHNNGQWLIWNWGETELSLLNVIKNLIILSLWYMARDNMLLSLTKVPWLFIPMNTVLKMNERNAPSWPA